MASDAATKLLLTFLMEEGLKTKKKNSTKGSNIMKTIFRKRMEEDRDFEELMKYYKDKDKKNEKKSGGIDTLGVIVLAQMFQIPMILGVLFYLSQISK